MYLCALTRVQITVGGILMLKNSDTEAPEDLIEPLKGELKEVLQLPDILVVSRPVLLCNCCCLIKMCVNTMNVFM